MTGKHSNEEISIDHILKGMAALTKQDLKNHIGETAYSDCEIHEGYQDYLKIQVKEKKIGFFINDFDWSMSPDFTFEMPEAIDSIPAAILQNSLIPKLKTQLADFIFDSANQPMFRCMVEVVLDFQLKENPFQESYYLEDEKRKVELRERMNSYINDVVYKMNRRIKDSRELSVFTGNLLNFKLMDFAPTKLMEIIDHCLQSTFKAIKNKKFSQEFEQSLLYDLNKWVNDKFKPQHFDIETDFFKTYSLKADFKVADVNPEQLALWVYSSYLRIKCKDYPADALQDLQLASKDFGSATAQQYLSVGTGAFTLAESHYKDQDLICIANDVFATFSITIKNESSESYGKALDFIIHLLQNDFPPSYALKLSSKTEKQFFPIKGIAKSSTHRFFANAMQYPALHDKIAQYAQLAMKEFTWYTDVEAGEKSCMPGSYAVFGLALASEKYFPLVHRYFELLDDEHQMVHKYFISTLIDQYALTKNTVALICAGILSAQFEMTYKNLATLMEQEENVALLLEELKNRNHYHVEEILFSIWGRNYSKTIDKLNPDLQVQLRQLLDK